MGLMRANPDKTDIFRGSQPILNVRLFPVLNGFVLPLGYRCSLGVLLNPTLLRESYVAMTVSILPTPIVVSRKCTPDWIRETGSYHFGVKRAQPAPSSSQGADYYL